MKSGKKEQRNAVVGAAVIGGAFAVTLNYVAGEEWIIGDQGSAATNNVTIGTGTDTINGVAGPLIIDTDRTEVRIVADPDTANTYEAFYGNFQQPQGGYYGEVADNAARFALTDNVGQYGLQQDTPFYMYAQIASPPTATGNWVRWLIERIIVSFDTSTITWDDSNITWDAA